jgi:hypothetical protein
MLNVTKKKGGRVTVSPKVIARERILREVDHYERLALERNGERQTQDRSGS